MYDTNLYKPSGLFQQSWLQMRSPHLQLESEKPKKTKKTVTFYPHVNVVMNGSEPLTEEEKNAAWYKHSDYKQIKRDIRATMELLQPSQQLPPSSSPGASSSNDESGSSITATPASPISSQDTTVVFDENEHCSWGMPVRGTTTIAERQKRKKVAVHAVLMEQLTQKMELEGFQNLAFDGNDSDSSLFKDAFEYDDESIALVYKGCVSQSVEEAYYLGMQMSNEMSQSSYYRSTTYPTAEIGRVGCSSAVIVNFCSLLAQEHKVMGRRRSSIKPQPQRTSSASNQMITAATFFKSFAGISSTLLKI